MKKTILISAIIFAVCITFASSYDVRGTEELTYIIALGIDKSNSEDEPYTLSIQIAKPNSSESGGSQITTETQTTNCNSFNLGLAIFNLENVYQINLSHCTALIISEELATEGLDNIINTLANNIEIRPTCNVLICQNKASDFLKTASEIEDISSKYYSSFIESAKITSYITPCELSNFYSSLHKDVLEPVALYCFTKENTIESLGLAIFKNYKMVGRTSGLETICYNILTNNFEEATIDIYNYQTPGTPLSVNISSLDKTKIKVKLENNKPKIQCQINVNSKILSANKDFDFSTEDARKKIEAEINKFIDDSCTAFLYKTSQDFGSDIIGFKGHFNQNFLTQDSLDKYNWDELYKEADFEVTCTNHLLSGFLFSKT